MSDDHSANAVSCYQSILAEVFKTPNLDRIADAGARLNRFYSTNSICTPARATIMTGQYGHVNGVRTLSDRWIPSSLDSQTAAQSARLSLAALLRDGGYTTSVFGKWHLHCEPQGFDDYSVLTGADGQGTYRDPLFFDKGRGEKVYPGYVTDIITKKCLDWLAVRDKSRPFFMMCHHKAPHDFWEYAPRHEHLFDGVDIPVTGSLFEDKSHRSIASRDYGSSVTPRSKVRSLYRDFLADDYVTGPLKNTENMTFEEKGLAAYQKYLKDYLRTVKGIDDSVGSVLDELKNQDLLDNTVIVYTSDQGMFLGEHDYQDKRWSYEESLSAPFLISYPGEIMAGSVLDSLMANIDIAPTLLDYAGIKIPPQMQGFSCRNMIACAAGARVRESVYFRYWMHRAHRHDNPAHYGILTERWKLIYYYGLPLDAAGAVNEPTPAGWELYDMQNDPYELKNLYEDNSYKNTVNELKIMLKRCKEEYKDTDVKYPLMEKWSV
ncbi:MAG: sulfatase [Treponema sp.]|nr:sulfatase [Treponema sp.]